MVAEAAYRKYRAEKDSKTYDGRGSDVFDMQRHEEFADKVHDVFRQISKSNLLARLLYSGEKLRKEACPEHKGHWSGIEWLGNTCPHRCRFTGWIQESDDVGKPLPGVRIMVSK